MVRQIDDEGMGVAVRRRCGNIDLDAGDLKLMAAGFQSDDGIAQLRSRQNFQR